MKHHHLQVGNMVNPQMESDMKYIVVIDVIFNRGNPPQNSLHEIDTKSMINMKNTLEQVPRECYTVQYECDTNVRCRPVQIHDVAADQPWQVNTLAK